MKKLTLLLIIISVYCYAQEKKGVKTDAKANESVEKIQETKKKEVKEGEMKQYFLVLLKRGPNRTQDSTTAKKIQQEHIDNINRLYEEGKIDLAGPMGHDGELRGIFVFNCDTYEEVLMHCNTDPAVKSGRLVVEIYPWWSEKGAKLR